MVNGCELLSVKRSLNKNSTAKISVPQMIKSMRFLTECGIDFDGIDLSMKKTDILKIEAVEITYPDYLIMLTGWKALFSNFCFQGLIVGKSCTSKKSLGIHKSDDFVYSYDRPPHT